MNPPHELKGIWAGLPTPWNEKGILDADAAYDGLVTHLAGFLRRPHLSLPDHASAEIKKVMDEFPEWNWADSHPDDSNAPR